MASLLLGFVIGTVGILPLAPLGRGVREPYAMVAAQVWARAVVQGFLATRVVVTGDDGLVGGEGAIRVVYFAVLISHVLLAMAVAPMVITTLVLGLRGRFESHRKIGDLLAMLSSH